MTGRSLLIVNYRTAALALQAITSARLASLRPLQVVVVDHSADSAEADLLRPACDELVVATENRGFAAGVNSGRERCSGEVLIVANPDLEFAPGSIEQLCQAVEEGASVAGPGLTWDRDGQWLLPPAEAWRAATFFDGAMASRSPAWRRYRQARLLRRRIAFWRDGSARDTEALSGAVLAISSRDFDSLQGLDERFFLYFEETDFLRRVRRSGRRIRYIPSARCRHLYNQSTGQTSLGGSYYAASESLYLRKWFPLARRLMRRSEEFSTHETTMETVERPLVYTPEGPCLVEASPLRSFEAAAGRFCVGPGAVELPDEVWSTYRQAELFLRVIELGSMKVTGSCRVQKLP